MKKNARNLMESSAGTTKIGLWWRTACIAFMLALTLGRAGYLAAQAAPAAQQSTILDVEYVMDVGPRDVELCVGETADFYVTVPLVVTEQLGAGPSFETNEYYPGEEVKTEVEVKKVGSFYPLVRVSGPLPQGGAQLGAFKRWSGSDILRFEFTAEQAGTTIVKFIHSKTSKRLTPARTQQANVQARDCYEAIQSAMAKEWREKYICNIEKPFILAGTYDLGLAGTYDTKAEFTPFQGDPLHGSFLFTGTHSAGGCVDLAAGQYTMKLKPWIPLPGLKEGNIIFNGAGIAMCPEADYPIQNIGYEIKILPDAPDVCVGP
jgi:hypothetical protein